jgi:ribonuclease Z
VARPHDWPRVLISHHHSDHSINLGHLLITRWIVGQNVPFEVWGPPGMARQVDKLLEYLHWDIEVRRARMHQREPPLVQVTDRGGQDPGGGRRHRERLPRRPRARPAGLRLSLRRGGRSVVVSGDTRPSDNLMRWSRGVDCLIHECCEMSKTGWFPGCGWPSLEEKIRGLASHRTQPEDIGRVAAGADAGKLVITHLMPGSVPAELESAAARCYGGPIVVGQDLQEV